MKDGVFMAKKQTKNAKGSKLKIGIAAVCAAAAIGVFLPEETEAPVKEKPAIVQEVEETKSENAPTKTSSSSQSKIILVGSSESDKYHVETCRWAKEIKESNLVYFESVDDAKNNGYIACGTCKPK